jgi:pyruvate formate lyase activating enzyme
VAPTLRFAERLAAMGKPVWVRYVLVPGLTDEPANVEGVARFVGPMKNVEWVEVLPFHQLGAFKWKELGLDYRLADTPPAPPDLIARVLGQFRDAGCNAR